MSEYKEPNKIELIERIVKKSTVQQNDIDGECVLISLEHVEYLIGEAKRLQKEVRAGSKYTTEQINRYRNVIRDMTKLIEDEKSEDAALLGYDVVGT